MSIQSRAIFLPRTDIDTDQIIPARFLTTVSDEGFAQMAFADWRFTPDGQRREGTPFDDWENADGDNGREISILVAGHNFGCGSSREHAVWALRDLGIRAVVSSRIADIFSANAVKNGLAPVVVPEDFSRHLFEHPQQPITIDLNSLQISSAGQTAAFPLDAFAQKMMLEGRDHLDYLLSHRDAIEQFEAGGGATPWMR